MQTYIVVKFLGVARIGVVPAAGGDSTSRRCTDVDGGEGEKAQTESIDPGDLAVASLFQSTALPRVKGGAFATP